MLQRLCQRLSQRHSDYPNDPATSDTSIIITTFMTTIHNETAIMITPNHRWLLQRRSPTTSNDDGLNKDVKRTVPHPTIPHPTRLPLAVSPIPHPRLRASDPCRTHAHTHTRTHDMSLEQSCGSTARTRVVIPVVVHVGSYVSGLQGKRGCGALLGGSDEAAAVGRGTHIREKKCVLIKTLSTMGRDY